MTSKIFPISSDASFRKFYRIIKNDKSKIIVISKKEKYINLLVYVAINKFLRKNRILAPKLISHNYSKGMIIIEDFGDLSLQNILLKKKNKLSTYKKILSLLIKIQKIKPKIKLNSFLSRSHLMKKYSNKYLHKESDLFFDWYLPLFFKKKKISKIKKETKKTLTKLYKKLNFPNSCFVHRDFHAQNLMKVGKKIGLIDNQDALIGNPAYDLVSLVDDVRVKTSKKLKDEIFKHYLKKKFLNNKDKSRIFLEDFNILSVQRSLKIIGIFSRLFKRDKKNKYLKMIPYTWSLLEMRMGSKIFSELKKILDRNISKKMRKRSTY